MRKWFSSIVKDIGALGDKVYVYDPSGLLRNINLKNELIKHYKLHEFSDYASLYVFFSRNRDNRIIVFSSNRNATFFIKSNFRVKEIRLNDIFPELDVSLLEQLDSSYYQTLHSDYCIRKNLRSGCGEH